MRITPSAASQIRKAAEQSNTHGLCLRIAVGIDEKKAIHYGMGFDERKDDDVHVVSEGVELLIADGIKDILMGAVLDYVEINPGEHQFIFTNPNDPAHTRVAPDKEI